MKESSLWNTYNKLGATINLLLGAILFKNLKKTNIYVIMYVLKETS